MSSPTLRRPRPGALLLLLLALALLSLVAVLAADAAGGDNLVLMDAGPVARLGAPIAATLADLAGALTLGGAVVAGWLLREEADRTRALAVVAGAAAVTTLARGASLAFSYAIATGQPVGSPRFGSDLAVFLATDLGVWLLTALVAAAATTTVALLGTSQGLARAVAVLAGVVAFAAAMTGHAAGDQTHEVGTSTMLVHLLAVGIWVGGLAVLQILPRGRRDDLRVLRGYSHLALICWIALAASGVWAIAVRMNGPADILTSPYVQIGLGKAVLLLALGGLGALQRRQLATGFTASDDGRRARATYRRLALLELALMGLAVALAAAMSSSPPPTDAGTPPPGAAGILTGYPLPPAPDLGTVLTQWRPDPFGMALACVLVLAWWRPTAPERPRRDSAMLVVGAALLVLLTSGPLNVYGKVLISAHVLQHLLLLVPAGVLIGAAMPVPSRLRALVGGRWWAAALLALAGPALLVLAYIGPFLRVSLDGHAAHLALQMLSLGGGALTALAVRTVAGGGRRAVVAGLPLLLGVAAGMVLLVTDDLMAASWFGATGRDWGATALDDQHLTGVLVLVVACATALASAVVALAGRRRAPRA
ncbi:CopD family protein [Brachybacterium aquaticum]|uniref:Putative copper resistance protein D n=1 Tax=Brachybacterium aquaticum TaxID=1432564 RepID=A0A841AB90_9MICO|nr:CopD family protein [Brachybacterium aquaticum]MBB5830464.1 putative copper resistance protein D [Brachybacterium aquaticum]